MTQEREVINIDIGGEDTDGDLSPPASIQSFKHSAYFFNKFFKKLYLVVFELT